MGHGGGKKDDQETKKVLHINAILLQNRMWAEYRSKRNREQEAQSGTIYV
jgi:hypothetical protein